jgi:hypothetical protein
MWEQWNNLEWANHTAPDIEFSIKEALTLRLAADPVRTYSAVH